MSFLLRIAYDRSQQTDHLSYSADILFNQIELLSKQIMKVERGKGDGTQRARDDSDEEDSDEDACGDTCS